jgi:sensor histidine kinase YesM
MPRWSPWVWYGAAWLPAGILWFVYALRTRDHVGYALVAATVMMGSTALLGVVVWRLSELRWTPGRRGVLLLVHVLYGAVFVVVMASVDAALVAWHDGTTIGANLRRSGGLLAGDKWTFLALYLITAVYLLAVSVSHWIRARGRLAEQEVAVAKAQAQAAQEQLRALRAQLDPHFLFNILHSLGSLVRSDPAGAETALEHLGEMLRYVLDDAAGDEVELADEWSFVRHYLALESLRFRERLRIETEIDPESLDGRIPPFTMQLLVENAIRHGIARRPRGGTVSIRTSRQKEELLIRVVDDGVGASLEGQAATGTGLGLRALRRRLETRYDGRAAIEIRTAPGQGFDVTVRLPCEALFASEATA